eukprot:TRINITY_DN93505_c0_g1_i1.p1 TRINITY_DN93505_c0_g1~~TRINITY_DN93505_c0_g1_i1.p1  ORF type:complete len:348 (+),score=55.65 TRINITY_DN93505_c0_g1_i1:27-1046(+)
MSKATPRQGAPLQLESWPARFMFMETDAWPSNEAGSKSKVGRKDVAIDHRRARAEEKWWHVSDQQIEDLVQNLGDTDALDEMLRAAAKGESSNHRLQPSGDESNELTARPNQIELSDRTLASKSSGRIKLNIHFVESGDGLELTIPPGMQLAPASSSTQASPRAPKPAEDRASRALRALLAPLSAADEQHRSDHERSHSLKGILAQLVGMDAESLKFYSKGVPLVMAKGTVKSLGIRDGDTLSVQLRQSRGPQPPPLREVLSQRLRRAAAWDAKLKPRWRWSERPNLFKPLGSKSNHHAGKPSPREFSSYPPYQPETKFGGLSPRLQTSLQEAVAMSRR